MKKETIYLAGGCFWGTEKYMQGVDGVLETRVGYALGEKPLWNPPLKESVTYEEVCNHSGHAEAVEVVFDAEKNLSDRNSQGILLYHRPDLSGQAGHGYRDSVPHGHLFPH